MNIFKKNNILINGLLNDTFSFLQDTYNQTANLFTVSSAWGQILFVLQNLSQMILYFIEDSITELNIEQATRDYSVRSLARLSGYDETALVKTVDLIQPCTNPRCDQKWYVFDNSTKPVCPFCGTAHKGKLPVLNLYSSRTAGKFMPDNHRVMVYTNQSFFPWHASRLVMPNEKLKPEEKKRIGYFVNYGGSWWLVNEGMPDLTDKTDPNQDKPIPIGGKVELVDGQKLLLSKATGGRVVVVQMVDA